MRKHKKSPSASEDPHPEITALVEAGLPFQAIFPHRSSVEEPRRSPLLWIVLPSLVILLALSAFLGYQIFILKGKMTSLGQDFLQQEDALGKQLTAIDSRMSRLEGDIAGLGCPAQVGILVEPSAVADQPLSVYLIPQNGSGLTCLPTRPISVRLQTDRGTFENGAADINLELRDAETQVPWKAPLEPGMVVFTLTGNDIPEKRQSLEVTGPPEPPAPPVDLPVVDALVAPDRFTAGQPVELTVSVKDAAGQLIPGVPIQLSVEPAGAVTFQPPELTSSGEPQKVLLNFVGDPALTNVVITVTAGESSQPIELPVETVSACIDHWVKVEPLKFSFDDNLGDPIFLLKKEIKVCITDQKPVNTNYKDDSLVVKLSGWVESSLIQDGKLTIVANETLFYYGDVPDPNAFLVFEKMGPQAPYELGITTADGLFTTITLTGVVATAGLSSTPPE